jgi:hypothetical protein
MIEGSGAGSMPLTSGSGSWRPKKKHVDPLDPDPEHCFVRTQQLVIFLNGLRLAFLKIYIQRQKAKEKTVSNIFVTFSEKILCESINYGHLLYFYCEQVWGPYFQL